MDSWQTMTPKWPGQGATRLHRVTVMIVISIAATLQRLDLWRHLRTAVRIDVGSAAVDSVIVTGAYSGALVISTVCVDRHARS